MKRTSIKIPGWDCVRHPCGENGCGTRPGAGHGIHCEDWVYVVSDGRTALSLTVFSGVYPESVPPDRRPSADSYPCGTDLSLHISWPVDGGIENECEFVDGGRCYQGGRYSTASGASEFAETYFRKLAGFDQPEVFWLALEAEHAEWSRRAADERAAAAEAQIGGGI